MGSADRVNQLSGDANLAASFADAALKDISHAQFTAHLANVRRCPFVYEARVPGDHEELLRPRQRGDDVLDDAVGEVLLLRVAAHVLERQYSDRWLIGKWQR